jgi:hypothetical protein
MGHSSLLDIIGSFATGGLIILIILRLNMSASETRQTYGYNYRNQTNLTTLMMLMEDDFTRIGYSARPNDPQVTPATLAILAADSNLFQYRTDINSDSICDVIEYSISSTPDISFTENPNDRYLTKKTWMNGGGTPDIQHWSLGVTRFNFTYFKSGTETLMPFPINSGIPGNTPQNIGLIQLDVKLESPEKPKQEFLGDTSQYQVFWRQVRVTSKNLLFR